MSGYHDGPRHHGTDNSAWPRLVMALAAVVGLFLATSCASIVHGTRQDILIDSTPQGAKVSINEQSYGLTPVTAQLKKNEKEHRLLVELEGFEPHELVLERKFSAWYIGNIGFGGLIGLIVDAANGAMYRISPKEVQAILAEQDVAVRQDGADLVVGVTLSPKPEWEKVGQLRRASE